ncbi:MAG TPA: CPBP family intramembrane glutamic endopeptidase [Candidatus Sulfotelmatobacter sp.]|nr:CPBP family intramembrane glutamic endopeptidase [Candidatus Sulfotelmatobacter sp.]
MQATDEILTVNAPPASGKPEQIASWGHFVGFLLIMAGMAALGFLAQHAGTPKETTAAAGQLADHSKAISVYLVAGVMDWALLYYCWAGVHRRGGSLGTLSGGRWTSWGALATDVAIAAPFFALWEAAAYAVHWALGPSGAKSVDSLLPRSLLEILIWIAVSITAGFCEEIAFRGYLQRQFHALSGSIAVAVLAQALVFGLAHGYQGWKSVIVIIVLGALYGALAAWRRNLRACIVAHAWSDIWEGWLKMVIWK